MRVTRKVLAARYEQAQAQLNAQNNPGRIKLKASLVKANETIEKLNKKIDEMDDKFNVLLTKNTDLASENKTLKEGL